MFIKSIKIEKYRNFYNTKMNFNEGINVIVGANNSGKTNILHIISLLSTDIKLNIDDINKNDLYLNWNSYLKKSPSIEIEYRIAHTMNYDVLDSSLTRLENFIIFNEKGNIDTDESKDFTINALIKLKYELNPKMLGEYTNDMKKVDSFEKFIRTIKKYEEYFEMLFYNCTSNEIIEKKKIKNIFCIDSINASRNTEDITINTKKYVKEKTNENKNKIKDLSELINMKINEELKDVNKSINDEIKKDQTEIGVTNGKNNFISTFEFDSDFTEFFKYELQNDKLNYTLPLESNGLGYNNLIYIRNSINLKRNDEFNLLMIEEPEAHLHPNMQYKLIKYIEHYRRESKNFNQVFITTHSSNISSAAQLDDVIMVYYDISLDIPNVICINARNNFDSEYIKNNYAITIEQNELNKYKCYLQKFLDVTKSDMLFADKVILVEGISEKIYIPSVFEHEFKDSFINQYISIIEVGGITLKNFLPLFIGTNKKVICISDVDYDYDGSVSYAELFKEEITKKLNTMGKEIYKSLPNFAFCTELKGGSTFEKEIFLENYDNNLKKLLNLAFSNEKLNALLSNYSEQIGTFNFWKNEARDIIKDERVWNSIEKLINNFSKYYEQDEKNELEIEKYFFCELFYKYIKNKKGDFALNLCLQDWIKHPEYIVEGLKCLKQ